MKSKKEVVNESTGEIVEPKFGEMIIHESLRPNGSRRFALDFSNCPTMAEQHTAHLTDINYLIEKYKPDELQAYLNARSAHKQEIVNPHGPGPDGINVDFSQEPSLQDGLNVVYRSKQNFENLPDDIKMHFRNHVEFMKFIDIPGNAEKLVRLRVLSQEQLDGVRIPDPASITPTTPPKSEPASDKKKEEK